MRRAASFTASLLLLATFAFAQAPAEVSYTDDFQSYGTQANPPGWIDTSVGTPKPTAAGLYKTWPEPLDKNSANVVYGTKQASGKPEGNNPRIGTFSTLSTRAFSGKGRFEYRGRMIRTNDDSRIGLTFFSSYPETDRYYLLGLWSQPSGNLTMQLFGFGGGTPTGTIDSNQSLTPNQWYRFVIQVDDTNEQTKIRARFWPDGQPEPATFSIDATDASATRLTSGRIGIWAAVKGDAYVDDLFAKSPVDHTAPSISILESGNPLVDGTKFNRDATPEIKVSDDLSTFTYTATLDGAPYTSLTPVTAEGWHTLVVTANDGPGNSSTQQVKFLVDKTPPVVAVLESGAPFPAGFFFNRDVIATANATDISTVTLTATLDGNPYTLGSPIVTEGQHSLSVTATDEVGWTTTAGPIAFVIDKTPPALTFTSHQNGAVLTAAHAIAIGGSDDAVTVTVNNTPATLDAAAKTFTSIDLPLLEGENTLVATGTDRAGNTGRATLTLVVDTRAPELTIVTPAADACVDAASLTVTGTVSDPRIDSVKVTIGDQTVTATVTGTSWTATVPVAEGKALITVEARDLSAHTASVSRTVIVDRTAPVLEVTNSGSPFTATLVNRAVSLFIRATDAEDTLTSTLDGNAYASGTQIAGEGAHKLVVKATDCAGHVTERTFDFTIDLTPPALRELQPPNGGTVGTMPAAISGRTDADTETILVEGTQLRATIGDAGAFSIAGVPFAEGTNRFALIATDRAGNSATVDYSVVVRTAAPVVEIRESGLTIPAGQLYNRAVTPVIRTAGGVQATIAATLNGAPYTSGTTITADGQYQLSATATDDLGHSGSAQATFVIDRTPPVVQIAAPVDGASVQTDRVEVRGTAGDAIAATLNGMPLTLAENGSFVAELPLEYGPNPVVVTARDRAGNSGRDDVSVTRDDVGTGIILTYPPDHSMTNRPTTDVVGRLLTAHRGTTVTIGTQSVPLDPTGAFRVTNYPLVEGENTITATATATNGLATSATTHVTADFTPPSLVILESNQPLADSARCATQAVVSVDASDVGGGAVTVELTIDGTLQAALPSTITAAGGHSLVATARDRAGNQARSERMLFIGTSSSTADCRLEGFDPANNAVVLSDRTTLVGRSGGALGVKVNGIAAIVADGSFSANVELPNEGPNVVTISCTDAAGTPTGTPVQLTLQRVTGDPSISITSPNEGFITAQETITVTGTVGPGVVSADVNGTPAVISGSNFTATGVRLSDGLNILVAHGRNGAGRTATASRRGTYEKDAPSISISTPIANTTTGLNRITVGGTYTNLDPATITVTNTSGGQSRNAESTIASDTTGAFTAVDVPLTSGEQTLRVTGRDRLNRQATANVVVKLVSGSPSIVITSPANQSYFPGGSETFPVTGTFTGAAGSTVDVNGSAATISGTSYSATAKFSTLITPVVARVTEPSGASSTAMVFVTQLVDAPRVVESFPAGDAVEVDAGALVLVLFSQPMDVASLSAFRLEDANGAPVSGTLFLDKEVLTFAPATLLSGGTRYTIRVGTGAQNLAGTPLATAYASSFTVAANAPSTPPTVNPIGDAVCGQSITVTGTAAPSARVRLESGALVLTAAADASGKFTFTYPLSGQSGFTLVRVRTIGSDGSLSPAAELTVRVDCSGPQVLNASFDRNSNALAISFSENLDASTVGVGTSIVLVLTDGTSVAGTASVAQNNVTVLPAADLRQKTFTLTVGTTVEDTTGNRLITPYSQEFAVGSGGVPQSGDGSGFISGEVYDATTGRPLPGATIAVDVASPAPITTTTDARGRYLTRIPEGAHTISASHAGHTSVWREIIVPAGAGVIPIDIRLTRRGDAKSATGSPLTFTHGGDTAVTRKVDLTIPSLPSGASAALTSVGAQALTGLLPLGWSPLASAEVHVEGAPSINGSTLTFHTPAGEVATASQNLTAVHYDAVRDEWRVVQAVVNIGSDGRAAVSIGAPGAYALVYPDKVPGLTAPPLPVAGDVLQGVPSAPANAPELVDRDFKLDPAIVLPTGRAVATLRIEGAGEAKFPSGTAVQAYIDEELRLADGSRLLDPPFATDLLLYRTLSGDLGIADFHLAPSAKAAQVVLEVGFEHIRVLPYPGRLDRGTLIGSEGGRVPADDKVAVEIPTGAVPEALRATATSLSAADLNAVGTVAGFRVVGGFQLTLQRATQPAPQDLDGDGRTDEIPAVELFVSARATFSVDASKLPGAGAQVILAELLNETPYGRMLRLAAPMMPVDGATGTPVIRFTTKSIDRSLLPVDGVIREGRYVVLAAEAPVAFATGTVRLREATGRLLADARVTAAPLGVQELTRTDGIYNIPVPAKPAAPFSLVPRHTSTGDGAAYTHAAQAEADAVIRVDLSLVPQPPVLGSVVVLRGTPPSQASLSTSNIVRDVALTTNIRASFTPAIDPSSIANDSITVVDAATGAKVSGKATADGSVAVVWTLTAGELLKANGRYLVTISPAIRGANGSTLGNGTTYTFTTVAQVLNTEVRRDRIRITIPDEQGISRVTGDAGALPAGWQAVVVRRGRDFYVRYQGTAAGDGSFAFFVGNGDPRDKVTMADLIDLRVVNNVGNLAAIMPLTPFVTADGRGFVAPPEEAVRFTSPEGISVEVPAGAFDVPTIVTVKTETKEAFTDVPRIEDENNFVAAINIEFDGFSNKPLNVEVPVPAGVETAGRDFLLAWKGLSTQGPRLAVADLMRVENGKFTNAPDEAQQNSNVTVRDLKTGTNRTLVGKDFSKYLMHLMRAGRYTVLDIRVPVGGSVGWGVIDGLATGYELMWDLFWSYFDPYIHVFERSTRVIPVLTGVPFTVTGIDASTGLKAFSRTYDPIPVGEPGTAVSIPSPQQNDGGPYPVFAAPFRVETLDLDVEDLEITTIRNFRVTLANGSVTVSPSADSLGANVDVELLNVTKGSRTTGTGSSTMTLGAGPGDRIALLIEQTEVDAQIPLSVVFNEPIFTGQSDDEDAVDVFLHDLITLEQAPEPVPSFSTPTFSDITAHARFTMDSGGRRVNIELGSALQRGAVYRVTLKGGIADITTDGPGLKLGQGTRVSGGQLTPVGGGADLHLTFQVRKPAGELGSFLASDVGLVRNMELYGNVLFVTAMNGGLKAFDVSNPASITGNAPLLASLPGGPDAQNNYSGLTVDRHGRVIVTVEGPVLGVLRTYRVEDFINGTVTPASAKASSITNWRLGYSNNIGLPSNTVLSDRPESIPFKVRVVLQDVEEDFADRQEFIELTSASQSGDLGDDLKTYTLSIPHESDYKYERITVENVTLDMRWSADAEEGGSATITGILARGTDRLRLVRNQGTYAVIAHMGYGIGVYDLNAMESNRHPSVTAADKAREQLFLGNGIVGDECNLEPPFWAIGENYLNLDVAVRGDAATGDLYVYAIHPSKGVLDYRIHLPGSASGQWSNDSTCDQRGPTGLVLKSHPDGNEAPRIAALRSAVGGSAWPHFMSMAQYTWKVSAQENSKGLRGSIPNAPATREYMLVAGLGYGVIVVEISGDPATGPAFPLEDSHIADVLWVPGGAAGVRVIQESNIAVVSDRNGRVVLIDLSRIDERWDADGGMTSGLFPTARKAIAGAPTAPGNVGADDPRIIWSSESGITGGSLPPVLDPLSGIVFGAHQAARTVKILSAIDPTVRMKVNLGEGFDLSDVGGVVPLGVAPPENIKNFINTLPACGEDAVAHCKDNASLAAFRLEVALPGGLLSEMPGGELRLAVESERIAGAVTEQTPNGFPRSHLRRTRRDGSQETGDRAANDFKLERVVPQELAFKYKHQRGFNRFMTPWIVAIADPRASIDYVWDGASTPAQKEEAGCFSCERPKHLKDRGEDEGVFELWTNGRFISVRPELKNAGGDTVFDGTDYEYLGEQSRMANRFTTVMADTVRPTEVVVAAQSPPVATGAMQETVFLHSGELDTGSRDLDVGGRAGFNVEVARTYRSRTLGGSAFGQGWDSPMFRRLRALPNGDVEYRDGAEQWTFILSPSGQYEAPLGLYLKLARTTRGWVMIDQQWRVTHFDDLGRILSEGDEFFDPQTPDSGNTIRYAYDETGRLSQIVDPVKRPTTITYWKESEAGATGAYPGVIRKIKDWRERELDFHYDNASGTLTKVELPDVANTSGGRPTVKYTYTPAGNSFNDKLELRTNLATITDPSEAGGGPARLTFSYRTGSGLQRDRLESQKWGTGETVSFNYASRTQASTEDVLKQKRSYTLTEQPKDYFGDRAHIKQLTEEGVTTFATSFGQLPTNVVAAPPATTNTSRTFSFGFHAEGMVETATLQGVRSTTYSYVSMMPEAPGYVPSSVNTTGAGGAPLSHTLAYQSGVNQSTFVASMSINGQKVEAPEPSRNQTTVQQSNDSIQSTEEYTSHGLFKRRVSSGGTDSTSAGSETKADYEDADGAMHRRSAIKSIDNGGMVTTFDHPGPDTMIQTDSRGVTTTTTFDSWRRPVHVVVTGGDMAMDDRFEYDATGRVKKHTRKQGEDDVTTTYEYDVMGRAKTATESGTGTTTMTYSLASRQMTVTHPTGAVTTTTLDGIGRVASQITTTGDTPLSKHFAYDLDDNLVFETDLLTATATAFDAHGRIIGTASSDGMRSTATVDALGSPTSVKTVDSAGGIVGESTLEFTSGGRLKSLTQKVDAGQSRTATFAWDGGGRDTGMSDAGRATHASFDPAGRLLSTAFGAGTATAIADAFRQTTVSNHSGGLPQTLVHAEKGGGSYSMALEYNAAADVVAESIGNLTWKHVFDQAGNLTATTPPGRGTATFEYDARGSLKKEILPGGAVKSYDYTPAGALTRFVDPSNETTETTNDLVGRPKVRTFKDGTTEEITWEGNRVKSIKDRQGRTQTFTYNAKGQVAQIDGPNGVLDKIEYDAAGRVTKWTSGEAVTEYADFDFEGRPRQTTQSRVRNGTVIDKYTQDHTWNVHGERSSWTMPSYAGFSPRNPWTASIAQQFDHAGNLVRMERTAVGGSLSGAALYEADYRDAGRPERRMVRTSDGREILRAYGYHGAGGMLDRMQVTANGRTIAGSVVSFDGMQKQTSTLLGVSGGSRADRWSYDERSRLAASVIGRDGETTPSAEVVTQGDFRASLMRLPATPVDPGPVTFTEDPSGGHKLGVVSRNGVEEQFHYNGGERTEDGHFKYQYDDKGRLIVATQKRTPANVMPLRRVVYSYDGNDRVVGRRAEYAPLLPSVEPSANDWQLEDRPQVMAVDALPPDITLVWDPIVDRLVAIFKTGASENAAIDDNGGLVRQIIHGGQEYDDPVEVAVASASAPRGVEYLYPVYDEAGGHTLQVILNGAAQIVSRSSTAGPYGEDESVLLGAAVDKVSVEAKRGEDGKVAEVVVKLRSTEDIVAATLANGTRLAVVDAQGEIVRTAAVEPALAGGATVQWTLTEDEWNALVDPAPVVVGERTLTPAALSIAATKDLRAAAWSTSLPFLAAPEWARETKPVFASSDVPVEVRESLASLSSWLASLPADDEIKSNTLYEVPTLYALAMTRASYPVLIVASGFHAQPFQDPLTGKNFVRARWFDVETGTWLTPDPLGYRDSANLYAYCGNDPVNCTDPTGQVSWDEAWAFTKSAVTTVAIGVGTTVVIAGTAAALGVSAPVIITVGAVAAVGAVAYNGYNRYQAGHAKTVWGAAGLGVADVFGVTAGFEAYTGEEVGTGRKLSRIERAERAGGAFGTAATMFIAPSAARFVSRRVPNLRAPGGSGAPGTSAGGGGPGAGAGAPRNPAARPPRVPNPRHVRQAQSVQELDALLQRLGRRAVREAQRARAGGMSGQAAGNHGDAVFTRYAQALNNRLAAQGSRYVAEIQPAMLNGVGRIPTRPYEKGSLRLDIGLSDTNLPLVTNARGQQFPTLLRGYDITINARKINATLKYQGPFGVPIIDIR